MFKLTTEFAAGERVVRESMADHMQGVVDHGGKLWLTDRRLVFKARALLDPYELSFPLSQIVAAERGRQLTGPVVVVKLSDGREEKFRIMGSKDWAASINQARQGSSDATLVAAQAEESAGAGPPGEAWEEDGATIPVPIQPTPTFDHTRHSMSPFAGQERQPTGVIRARMDRHQRRLLLVVVLGLACVVAGGCALLLLMFAAS